MPQQASINLLDWRSRDLRRQAAYFTAILFITVALAALLLASLFNYQQRLESRLAQQHQQQTALRQQNQQLQQQLNQLQQNSPESAVQLIPDQAVFAQFIDFLSRLPLSQGRLSAAAIQPQTAHNYLIQLQGSTPSQTEFEQLRNSFEPYFQQSPLSPQNTVSVQLQQFNLQRQRLEFSFDLTLQPLEPPNNPAQQQPEEK
ncbi:hypothetical protein SAMN05660772_01150 [Pasteurella testudinis DSM 23072]|uniref:Tfp pilus assembly protein PilN n=1 Tax=Pasteurella testudinis DSM 23072 TaxID=1122938 RepID=A0A1W1V4J5_9PAST|nr:hypothetical protein [Pasteurella testudinis]SMB88268.1 hypothetical protein SAMN05660772_01150 [Pasteurella testudinis DSM 23072]SUB51147.1 Uncharacterised protein [Pasteurella testudinis]